MKFNRLGWLTLFLAACLGIWVVLLAVAQSYREPPNYTRIEDILYLGGFVERPPPKTTAVCNLCETEDPYQCDHHAWHPIRDAAPAPSLDWLTEQVKFIETQRMAGRTIFVHCLNGVSRGPTVMAGYLMVKNNWTRDEALDYLREKRPQVRPNPAFMDLLNEWEQASREAPAPARISP